jgi:hypothetical protein
VGGNHQAALIRVIHLPHALDLPQVDSPGPSYIDGVNTKGDGVGAETFGLDTGYLLAYRSMPSCISGNSTLHLYGHVCMHYFLGLRPLSKLICLPTGILLIAENNIHSFDNSYKLAL